MEIVPWRGDIFMQIGLKKKPDIVAESWAKYERFLRKLDPVNWKKYDHYKILRLEHLRYRATQEQIQKSYREIARRFHPDKMPGSDSYYPVVIRSSEILLCPQTRRAFDSVDPTFDDSIPKKSEVTPENFYEVFQPVFSRNARWSTLQPVPELGTKDSSFEDVDNFYKFWFDFDSWREYSYLDEEDKSRGQDRAERKAIEKSNKIERQQRRKEELDRIRTLVETAYSCDPRIVKFKEFKKVERQKEKEKRKEEIRQRLEAQKLAALEAEREEKRKRDEEKAAEEAERRKKEEQRKLIKKERRVFRQQMEKLLCNNVEDETERLKLMNRVEKMLLCLSVDELLSTNERLKTENHFDWLMKKIEELEAKATQNGEVAQEKKKSNSDEKVNHHTNKEWKPKEIELLIKAVRNFPPGTSNRWEVIATFLQEHGVTDYSEKDIMMKARRIYQGERYQTKVLQTKASETVVSSEPSKRLDNLPWTADEQVRLEQALRQYTADHPKRWDCIASLVQTRTKAECILRYRALVQQIQSKKAAKSK